MKVSFIGLGVMGFPMAGHLSSKNSILDIKVYGNSKLTILKLLSSVK